MAKTSVIERNKKRTQLVAKFQEKRAELKKRVSNQKLSLEERMKAQAQLTKLPRNSSATRLIKRCSQTG
nr:30S ribosomal protein S14 [Candidatus Babeliales bacterium]